MAEIFTKQSIDFTAVSANIYYGDFGSEVFSLVAGDAYTVTWDDVSYTCVAKEFTLNDAQGIGIGNFGIVGDTDTGEPFLIGVAADDTCGCYTLDAAASHTISISTAEDTGSTVEHGVILKNILGQDVVYTGVDTVKLKNTEGDFDTFSLGEAVSDIPITLDLANGETQTITAPDGTLVKSAVVTITGANSVDWADENLKYFAYQIDINASAIFLHKILYDVLYENTGSYDVNIPDTIAGLNVVIISE